MDTKNSEKFPICSGLFILPIIIPIRIFETGRSTYYLIIGEVVPIQ